MRYGIYRISAPVSGPVGARILRERIWRFDFLDGGRGTIEGTVTIENVPGSRRVRLYARNDGHFVRETWSAPDGNYYFIGLADQEYFVVSHDHTGVFNGVVQDMVRPEVS